MQVQANLTLALRMGECESWSSSILKDRILPQLEACGAAYLSGHDIAPGLLERILETCALVHSVDEKSKLALDVSKSAGARGYFAADDIQPIVGGRIIQRREYSSFEVGSESSNFKDVEERVLFADNVWPQIIDVKIVVMEYLDAMWVLAGRVFNILVRLLDLPSDYFIRRLTSPVFQLRLLEYASGPAGEQDCGPHLSLGAHTDYECFTILIETSPGLHVMGRNGNWYSVVPPYGNLVLLLGDLTEVISQGRLESVLHRVSPIQSVRHSCAFFVGLNPNAEVGAGDASRFRVGDHLFARTLENFPHLRARVEAGEIVRPLGFGAGNPFKRAKIERMKS
jgi:isopenicillin N synthase-like dioxygenase